MYDNAKHAYLDPYQDSFLNDKLFPVRDLLGQYECSINPEGEIEEFCYEYYWIDELNYWGACIDRDVEKWGIYEILPAEI